jgi:hypothetical protein
MPVPETTTADVFQRYVGGKCLRAGHGEAWRDIKAWIVFVQKQEQREGEPPIK